MERRLELIGEMTPLIWVHLIAALIALIVGALVLFRKKGDEQHRFAGRLWCATMFVVALSSFGIREINEGGFSAIHLLSIATLVFLFSGIFFIKNRARFSNALKWHFGSLQFVYAGGLLIAGGFTFLPFRLLGRLTFGETYPWINYVFVIVMVGLGIWLIVRTIVLIRSTTGNWAVERGPGI